MKELSLLLHYIPIIVIGILPIMNPLACVPLFMSLTRGMTKDEKKKQAKMACLYAFCILVAFLFLGNGIIALFGISLEGIRVAGGLIILMLSFKMLFPDESEAPSEETAARMKEAGLDFSFSPLAMPNISGPGTIAVVMGYGSQIPPGYAVSGHIVVVIGIAVSVVVAYMALSFSTSVEKLLKGHGIQAVSKIMGFLLACVAVQFIASGIHDFVIDLAAKVK